MMQRLKSAVFEPGLFKSSAIGVTGFSLQWTHIEVFCKGAILVGTALMVAIHLSNVLIRQWCPVRRQKASDCAQCHFKGTIFCSRCTKDSE